MKLDTRLLAAVLFALLTGCATVTQPPASDATTTETGTTPGTEGVELHPPADLTQPGAETQEPAAMQPIEPPQRAAMSRNRAVVSLLDKAHADADAGKAGAAGASLERALRIEPRNPWVWQELARIRLSEGQYDQAVSMARKSNSLSGGQRLLQAINWQVIGKARVAKGDSAGAEQAFGQAADLARQEQRTQQAPH